MNTIRDVERRVGIKINTFAVMHCMSPDKYKFIFSFDKDPFKSYNKYTQFIDELYSEMEELYYSFETPKEFGVYVAELGAYKNVSNPSRLAYTFERLLFKEKNYTGMYISQIRRWNDVLGRPYNRFLYNTNVD